MISGIHCIVDGEELTEPGAILFGPPVEQLARKDHICSNHYQYIMSIFDWMKETLDNSEEKE